MKGSSKGILALALGTFGLGMTEYVMMSILPDLAHDFGVSVPEAGHLISSYALGVCTGAPLVAVVCRNWPLKRILLMLVAVYAVGNLWFASSGGFGFALAARFFTGLPHGAFFGAGSIVASRLMPGKETTSVALMTLGMTVANLGGVPLGSFVANTLNWRWIFYFNAAWGVLTFGCVMFLLKGSGALKHSSVASSFEFLKHLSPWLLIFVTVLCQGGAFAMYSYVAPIMTHAGLALKFMPLFMVLVGAGMCAGNYFSGVVSDRITPGRATLWVSAIMSVSLLATYFDGFSIWATGLSVTVCATMLFALSSPMQLLLLENSPGGELMGGAMVQVAFNLGNAVGAYAGGLPLDHGAAPSVSALVGCAMASASFAVMWWFLKRSGSVRRA